MRLAVVLFNLGGPDSLDAVRPFLKNLFSDPAIIRLPGFLRRPLASLIASRRAPVAREIYARMGGSSPIVAETEAQARALEAALSDRGYEAKCFLAMRYWHPLTDAASRAVQAWGPDHIALLPLYPQFSTTTTASSLGAWEEWALKSRFKLPTSRVCCFPWDSGFISALAELLAAALDRRKQGVEYRVLFSAHGLPKRIVDAGDPYQWQVERTVHSIIEHLGRRDFEWTICYQSRVGPLEWIKPATDAEVKRAGAEGKGLIVVPVAFVSEHSETLVELDMDYAKLARDSGTPDYIRVPTVRTHPKFIAGVADLVVRSLGSAVPVTCMPQRICPADKICLHGRAA
jgi:protoporphyrin/coproporphyrin ferrochelatase